MNLLILPVAVPAPKFTLFGGKADQLQAFDAYLHTAVQEAVALAHFYREPELPTAADVYQLLLETQVRFPELELADHLRVENEAGDLIPLTDAPAHEKACVLRLAQEMLDAPLD